MENRCGIAPNLPLVIRGLLTCRRRTTLPDAADSDPGVKTSASSSSCSSSRVSSPSSSSSSSSNTAVSCATAAETHRSLILKVFSSFARRVGQRLPRAFKAAVSTEKPFLRQTQAWLFFTFLFRFSRAVGRLRCPSSGFESSASGKCRVLGSNTTISVQHMSSPPLQPILTPKDRDPPVCRSETRTAVSSSRLRESARRFRASRLNLWRQQAPFVSQRWHCSLGAWRWRVFGLRRKCQRLILLH